MQACVPDARIPGLESKQRWSSVGTQTTITCPPGTFVHGLGGGANFTDQGSVHINDLYPTPDLRTVKLTMTRHPASGMSVQALCAK
ncbi:hypothetical protein [Nonomuraea sp. LPB2021202275-12-8]|uniref:hypothetical protein n=1 Tax=Nonomuraea sp. LPB2021202275-12-8 TaxID=3120159 RepID=UPI00300D47F5